MFCKESWNHLISVCKSFLPVLIIEISFYILFRAAFIFSDNEFIERILQDTLKDPFSQNLEVWKSTFLEKELK